MAISHNRINYQVQTLWVGPSPSTGGHFISGGVKSPTSSGLGGAMTTNLLQQLTRIQTCNYSWTVNRVPVYQFGELAAIDHPILETPTVALNFSYLQSSMWNESGLGFHTQGLFNCVSGFINKQTDDRNFFIKIVPEGLDNVHDTHSNTDTFVIGIGNGFVNSYSTQAAVNSFPTVDIGVEGLNMTFYSGTSGNIPAIVPVNGTLMTGFQYIVPTANSSPDTGYIEATGNLDISVLRPGDITLSFYTRNADDEGIVSNASAPYSGAGVSVTDAHIQSYNLSFNMNRESLQRLGSKFAFSREIRFPVDATLRVDGIVTNYITGTISDMIACDYSYDVEVDLKAPVCPGQSQSVICRYLVKNAKLRSQAYSSNIGNNKTVTLEFVGEIGGPSQTTVGVFMSGISSSVAT